MRECVRCVATTKAGERCKRRTCMRKDYCFQHLRIDKKLELKSSGLPGGGRGLFSLERKMKGSFVADFTGRIVPRGGEQPYALYWNRQNVLNADSTQDAVGRYANTCVKRNKDRGHCSGNNAKFARDYRGRTAKLRATKTIQPGGEIFASYGLGYRV